MKSLENAGFKSIFIESNEIKYARIDSKDNLVITFKDPPPMFSGKPTFGFRFKLIADPTALNPEAEFKFGRINDVDMRKETEMVREGKLSEL